MLHLFIDGIEIEFCFNEPTYAANYALDLEPPFSDVSKPYPAERRIYATTEPSLFDCYTSRFEASEISSYYKGLILSWHPKLKDLPQTKIFQPAAKWVGPMEDEKVFGVSGFVSGKNSEKFSGYQMRHAILARDSEIKIPSIVYNHRGKWQGQDIPYPLPSKEPAFKYMFHLSIENCREDHYFTEKLIDSFACRTVPLYYGDPSIGDIFNLDGMIILKDGTFMDQINSLTVQDYEQRKEAIEDNFKRSQRYWSFDVNLARSILQGLGKTPANKPASGGNP